MRINLYTADPGQACLECSWSDATYQLVDQPYSCAGTPGAGVPATTAPAELGTLAAALLITELRKLLRNAATLVGGQLFLDTSNYGQHQATFTCNPDCRGEHEAWDIAPLALDPRVGLFLPCRVTLVETEHGVQVMSINPKNLSRLFNNSALDKACQEMYDLYAEIIEEATF